MKLENLVPPLELCKLIPAGEFADSVFIWGYSCDRRNTIPFVDERDCVEYCRRNMVNAPPMFPAPTLQEIMEVLPPYGKNEKVLAACVPDWADFDARIFGEHWRVGYTGDCSINDKNPAAAAMRLWLKLKGIEDAE